MTNRILSWVDAKERMPNIGEPVLCCSWDDRGFDKESGNRFAVLILEYNERCGEYDWISTDNSHILHYSLVTHWVQLDYSKFEWVHIDTRPSNNCWVLCYAVSDSGFNKFSRNKMEVMCHYPRYDEREGWYSVMTSEDNLFPEYNDVLCYANLPELYVAENNS